LKSNVSPIPKTKKAAKPKKELEAIPEVPKDLADKFGAVTAVATAHKLLQEGHFTYAHRNAVGVSLAFLEELYATCLDEAGKHPDAHLIPQIAKMIADRKAQDVQPKQEPQ